MGTGGGSSGDFLAPTEAIDTAGAGFERQAALASGRLGSVRSCSEVGTAFGFADGGQLAAYTALRQRLLTGLQDIAEDLDGIGANLHRTATTYRTGDEGLAIRQVGAI